MLKVTISKNVTGTSTIDGVVVANMSANLHGNGSININKNIMNKEVYEAHKEEVRADFAEFEQTVYEEEDNGNA